MRTAKELNQIPPDYKALICGRWRRCWQLDYGRYYIIKGEVYYERG